MADWGKWLLKEVCWHVGRTHSIEGTRRSASVYAIFRVILQHPLIGSLTPLVQGQEWERKQELDANLRWLPTQMTQLTQDCKQQIEVLTEFLLKLSVVVATRTYLAGEFPKTRSKSWDLQIATKDYRSQIYLPSKLQILVWVIHTRFWSLQFCLVVDSFTHRQNCQYSPPTHSTSRHMLQGMWI